jgi:hypothetical protein
MQINLAHIRIQGVNCAVFDANARVGTDTERAKVLADLTARVRRSGRRVEKSALAYSEGGQLHFYGTRDLVNYLAKRSGIRWTHTLDV